MSAWVNMEHVYGVSKYNIVDGTTDRFCMTMREYGNYYRQHTVQLYWRHYDEEKKHFPSFHAFHIVSLCSREWIGISSHEWKSLRKCTKWSNRSINRRQIFTQYVSFFPGMHKYILNFIYLIWINIFTWIGILFIRCSILLFSGESQLRICWQHCKNA